MNRGSCDCGTCREFRNKEPFCEWCEENCCEPCADARGAFETLEHLCKGCDEFSCLRCGDNRTFPYDGKQQIVYVLESKQYTRQQIKRKIQRIHRKQKKEQKNGQFEN